jgi:hypothetical protein
MHYIFLQFITSLRKIAAPLFLLSIRLSILLSIASCVTTPPKHKSKVKTPTKNEVVATSQGSVTNSAPAAVPAVAPAAVPAVAPAQGLPPATNPDDPCDSSIKFTDGEPIFLPETKVMLTRVSAPCTTLLGVAGHKKNAGWMSMGFPCTGAEGRIDWKGTNYARPKMVSFLLETSCGMGPLDHSKIKAEAMKVVGISATAPMLAFSPFVIQYWEVPGYSDADTSFIVDLRSGKGIDEAWVRFIKPKPLHIFLVGRENAWVEGNHVYVVEGNLNLVSKNRFTFTVDKAHVLKGDELKVIRTRCEELKPERDCARVFL